MNSRLLCSIQHLSIIGMLLFFSVAETTACIFLQSERTILFDERDLREGIDGEAIVDVTIAGVSRTPDHRFIALARINKVMKGAITGDDLRIVVVPSSCDRGLEAGSRGIVVGAITRGPEGDLEVIAISETFFDRYRRRPHSK